MTMKTQNTGHRWKRNVAKTTFVRLGLRTYVCVCVCVCVCVRVCVRACVCGGGVVKGDTTVSQISDWQKAKRRCSCWNQCDVSRKLSSLQTVLAGPLLTEDKSKKFSDLRMNSFKCCTWNTWRIVMFVLFVYEHNAHSVVLNPGTVLSPFRGSSIEISTANTPYSL
jgi:hypothetical protein